MNEIDEGQPYDEMHDKIDKCIKLNEEVIRINTAKHNE